MTKKFKNMKFSYKESKNKRAIRQFLIPLFHFNKVVGLAGPDINEYLEACPKHILMEIYENSPIILFKQLSEMRRDLNFRLKYMDVIKANANEADTLYDLDFCGGVVSHSDYIRKFTNNFMMTFSLRIGLQNTIDSFFRIKEEKIISRTECSSHIVFYTDKNNYLFLTYKDTSPMCVFAKIN